MQTTFIITMTDPVTGARAFICVDTDARWSPLDYGSIAPMKSFRPSELNEIQVLSGNWITRYLPPKKSLWERFLNWIAPVMDEPPEPNFAPTSEVSYYSGEAMPPALRSKWEA